MSSSFWDTPAARSDGMYRAEDFEVASYRLMVEQVLYHSDRNSKTAYQIVERYERNVRDALAPLGVDVHVNRQLRYAYAIPRHAKTGTATVQQTVFALVLRLIYEDCAKVGDSTDDGEVICDLVELAEKYKILTGRDLGGRGELEALMRTMKRWGIARVATEDDDVGEEGLADQPFAVVIRPAIVDLLGETALQRLSHWNAPEGPKDDVPESGALAQDGSNDSINDLEAA
jgi:hypothetical protein